MLTVLGFYQGDLDQATRLSAWVNELGGCKGHTLLLVRDQNVNGDEELQANFRKAFDEVTVITPIPNSWQTWPISANAVFSHVARHIEHFKLGPWFWFEPDAIPLVPGWLDKIEAEYKQIGKPFLGADVNIAGIERHMSGLGCYPEQMSKHAGMALIAHETAFDVQAARQIIPQAHFTKLIAHSWDRDTDARPGRRTFENYEQVEREVFRPHSEAVLYHASKDGSLIQRLREHRSDEFQPLKKVWEQGPYQKEYLALTKADAITTDIFIKTYPKDYEWLKYCFRSIEKFSTGFRQICIAAPDTGYPLPHARLNFLPIKTQSPDSYLSQQVVKLNADTFTDAGYILHIDSDTIFTQPVTPETFFKDGKPIWMITPVDQVHPDGQHAWRQVMAKFMGKEPEYEYMRRFPFLFPRWLYDKFRKFCEQKHGQTIEQYVMSQPHREFSEFNCIGFFAWEYHRDRFSWFDTSLHEESAWPVLTVDQAWSVGGLTKEIREKWETILGSADQASAEKIEPIIESPATIAPVLPKIVLTQDRSEEIAAVLGVKNNSLDWHLSEIAKHFTSPLAKGRVFKKLKSYPIVK